MTVIRNNGIQLFRVFFPSWKFFDEPVDIPQLYFRSAKRDSELGDWVILLKPPVRTMRTLLINSESNLYLACHSVLRQLEHDIGDLAPDESAAFTQSTSFLLTQNLVTYHSRKSGMLEDGMRYQFKVSRLPIAGGEQEDFVVSQVYEA